MSKLDEIIEKVDFYGLVSKKTQLKRFKEDQFRGLSPFTSEKTPSFFINVKTKTWYCFSSGSGGGLLDYVSKIEGLGREEALRFLAEYTGVDLGEESDQSHQTRKALKAALAYYQSKSEDILEYVSGRGLSLDALENYELGYSGNSDEIIPHLKKLGIRDESIVESGIGFRRDDGKISHRYKDRLMIPIRDEYGSLVSFTGRDLSGNSKAKYLHGPVTTLFKKKNIVWGLKNARQEITSKDYVVVTEGQMDAMALSDAGVPAVSILGASISKEQLSLISKITQNIYFTFDSDDSGERGLVKAFNLAREADVDSIIYAIVLPRGKDPDDFIREFGVEKFNELREDARSDTAAIVSSLIKTNYKEGASKASIAKKVLSELKDTFQKVFTYRSLDLIERISQEFGLDQKSLQEWISKEPSFRGGYTVSKKIDEMAFPAPVYERRILYAVLKEPSLVNRIKAAKVSFFDFSSQLVGKVLSEVPATCSPTEVFDILKTKLNEDEYDAVIKFFSLGMEEVDFDTSFEILRLKIIHREKNAKHDFLGRPNTGSEKEYKTVFREIIKS